MTRVRDITGQRFGRLVALRRGENHRGGYAQWWLQCDCGSEPILRRSNAVISGNTTSCGCVALERARTLNRSHGMSGHPAHASYKAAKTRCTNPRQQSWKHYGGRGIEFRLPPFEEFWAVMGPTWFEGATIERIDNDGHYELGNVRWATPQEQMFNTRRNNLITHEGETLPITEWARRLGMHPKNLLYRIRKWGVERALTTPKSERYK